MLFGIELDWGEITLVCQTLLMTTSDTLQKSNDVSNGPRCQFVRWMWCVHYEYPAI